VDPSIVALGLVGHSLGPSLDHRLHQEVLERRRGRDRGHDPIDGAGHPPANLTIPAAILSATARPPDPGRLYAAHRASLTTRLINQARLTRGRPVSSA
jgi:hypothetical protein